jgi:hypothetical protein
MSSPIFNDRHASKLLSRVREDVSNLRDDIASLLSHTGQKTLPHVSRELADQARGQLAAGSAYAASRLRKLRGAPPVSHTAGAAGGALLLALVAAGVGCYFWQKGCCQSCGETRDDDEVS